jgi:SAM-dependent methyltransferase
MGIHPEEQSAVEVCQIPDSYFEGFDELELLRNIDIETDEQLTLDADRFSVPEILGEPEGRYVDSFKILADSTLEKERVAVIIQREIVPELESYSVSDGMAGSLLDLGAGNGRITRMLSRMFRHVTAIDREPGFKEPLEQSLSSSQAAPDGYEVIIGDYNALELPKEKDMVLASHTLYYEPSEGWIARVKILSNSVSKEGRLVLVLSGNIGGKANLIKHFGGSTPPIEEFIDGIISEFGKVNVKVFQVDNWFTTKGVQPLMQIADIFLRDGAATAASEDVLKYLLKNHALGDGRFGINDPQTIISIQKQD